MENSSDQHWRQELLKRYLANECTTAERAHVEKWYDSLGSGAALPEEQELESLNKIRTNVLAAVDKPSRQNRLIRAIQPFLRVAAVLVLAVGAGLLLYRFVLQSQVYDKTFITGKGEQKTIVLPDRSVATLNADSRIRIQYDVRKKVRSVTLSGEACFSVTKNPESPFKVTANRITTQVLGTTFNVQAYDRDESVVVTVAEGKVAVAEQNDENKFVKLTNGLLPDQQLIYDRQTKKSFVKTMDARRALEWREGLLFFENASLKEIAAKLERKYDLDIAVTGPANSDCLYTFTLRDEPLSKALQILEKVSGTRIVQNKSNQFTFNTSACK